MYFWHYGDLSFLSESFGFSDYRLVGFLNEFTAYTEANLRFRWQRRGYYSAADFVDSI